eukprot:CAMPEP_0198580962 /NCGR_PEP_ID=MMETSP1462-20131121/123616_1 /TAXON_ID=1333877 /ORGANISM="Brandtodinium nutriculum, Strain RCC3387" /LENGTH=49 /DNA_ID= /DNA_START= /DNA_END= /DNA_ORIENTATION=
MARVPGFRARLMAVPWLLAVGALGACAATAAEPTCPELGCRGESVLLQR